MSKAFYYNENFILLFIRNATSRICTLYINITALSNILLVTIRTGEWRKLHNEELNDLYSLAYIVRVVKSRRVRWTEHVARMGEDRGVHRVLVGSLRERDHGETKT